jgi:hypothetical protein
MAVTRKRRPRSQAGTGAVTGLKTLVDSLIKENRSLKRKLARAEAKGTGAAASSSDRGIKAIVRRLERALTSTTARSRRRTSTATRGRSGAAAATRTRRPASPETQQKRLAALAKARAVRAAKKAQAS